MKYINIVSYGIGFGKAICFCIILLVTSVEAILYWMPGYFEQEYWKYQVPKAVSMELPDLMKVTDEMMAYLKDERTDLSILAKIEGTEQEFFNAREKAHMEDVKGLFQIGIAARRVCFLLFLLFLWISWKGKLLKKQQMAAYRNTALVLLGFTALLFLGGSNDFSGMFIQFHHLFFTNDLWLLDPRTDLLIRIVPEPFFMDTAFRIGSLCIVGIVGMLFYSMLWSWREKRGKKER